MKRKTFFTLLEVMIGVFLLLLAAGAVSWKMYPLIEKRKFQSDLERLRSRLLTCRHLALTMQADWRGSLVRVKNKWVFEMTCPKNVFDIRQAP